ncbi:MAG: isocitrate/isopropylmalate dehydrogenase family protein [Chloroflexaceae bacterium]|nr:isocitrate/isopropylmalate dehydrogenase family protein [Chloroflexaceae bacterium]
MKLCVIPGDGIGGEVITAARTVLTTMLPEVTITEAEAGWHTFQQTGTALPEATLSAAQQADAVLFGAVASPSHPVDGYRSPIVALRRALDLYANIRPTVSYKVVPGVPPVDLIVVRENTEGLYAGRERLEDNGNTAITERVVTRRGTERIVQQACTLASQRPRRKLTLVHKANVLRVSDGLFRSIALEVAQQYPTVTVEELLVDTAAMHIARSPERFDVVVTTNLFGDILSDVACIHGGGLGLASSANLGEQQALFEPVHGAAPDIAGQGIANPLAALGCLVLLFEWLAHRHTDTLTYHLLAQSLRAAIATTLREGPFTPDLGGTATTHDVIQAILDRLF